MLLLNVCSTCLQDNCLDDKIVYCFSVASTLFPLCSTLWFSSAVSSYMTWNSELLMFFPFLLWFQCSFGASSFCCDWMSNFFCFLSYLIQSYLEDSITNPSKKREMLGDSVAWAGCTIMYLLGQQLHFELFDFSYQFLNVAEIENTTVLLYQSVDRSKSPNIFQVRFLPSWR
jgi:hypothetical protein